MSSFGSTDIKILMGMTIAVLMISFTLPALGLGGEPANVNELPELDIDGSTFDLAGDQPEQPTKFDTVRVSHGPETVQADWRAFLHRSNDDRLYVEASPVDGVEEPRIATTYEHVDDGITEEFTTFGNEGDRVQQDIEGFVLVHELVSVENSGTENVAFTVSTTVEERPGASGFLSGIPIFGDALTGIYETVTWIGLMFFWVSIILVEYFINIFVIIAVTAYYLISLMTWLVGGYAGVVAAAPGFASIVLAVPGLLLSLELLKIGMIIINALWIG